MIEIKNIETYGVESAIRAMRMPMDSHRLSDSGWCDFYDGERLSDRTNICDYFEIGANDLELMRKLYKGGSPHSKFMRQISCSMTITAPAYWWAEFDTYKVGTVRNSSSFMHKGVSKEFTCNDFECNDDSYWLGVISELNRIREMYLSSKDPSLFLELRQKLPMSYKYTSEITTNYAALANMIEWRKDHRLPEWRRFVEVILRDCQYIKDIMQVDETGHRNV